MTHFSDEVWVDFARGLLPPPEFEQVRQHLDEGCERCRERSEVWQSIAQLTSRALYAQPPDSDIRLARAIYSGKGRKHIVPKLARIAALVFDSATQTGIPAFEVRSVSSTARRLLHREGRWAIDLRIESAGNGRISVTGQALKSGRKPDEAFAVKVLFMRDDTVLAETPANKFGEFELACDYEKNLQIYLDISGRQPIGIRLPDPDK